MIKTNPAKPKHTWCQPHVRRVIVLKIVAAISCCWLACNGQKTVERRGDQRSNCTHFRPDRGSHISAQGRADSPRRGSAALGTVSVQDKSPEGAKQIPTSMFRPFRAAISAGRSNPGRRHARKTRVALPWPDIWLPLRGGRVTMKRDACPTNPTTFIRCTLTESARNIIHRRI